MPFGNERAGCQDALRAPNAPSGVGSDEVQEGFELDPQVNMILPDGALTQDSQVKEVAEEGSDDQLLASEAWAHLEYLMYLDDARPQAMRGQHFSACVVHEDANGKPIVEMEMTTRPQPDLGKQQGGTMPRPSHVDNPGSSNPLPSSKERKDCVVYMIDYSQVLTWTANQPRPSVNALTAGRTRGNAGRNSRGAAADTRGNTRLPLKMFQENVRRCHRRRQPRRWLGLEFLQDAYVTGLLLSSTLELMCHWRNRMCHLSSEQKCMNWTKLDCKG